ncbi:hypothetical protein V1L52_12995 [Treponema sp. HNW]|uniref:helicase-associated domain-containing protein n=1 Tax=Treponema sp. HNW TaxID=3116654 RepID=UPI003D0D29FE
MNKKAEEILLWHDFLTGMNETRFFDLVRLYVGEVKTPYNKRKLIEALTSFLHKEENRRVLFALLSEEDLILIASVIHIPRCTKQKAAAFFASRFSFAFLHDGFLNLEERLILFRKKDENGNDYFAVNPLLCDELEKRAPAALLFLPENTESDSAAYDKTDKEPYDSSKGYFVSAHLLASWFAFTAEFPDCRRIDGSFKKKAAAVLEKRFPGIPQEFLSSLHRTLANLSVFRHNAALAEVDKAKRLSFALLPPISRYAYLCAAYCGYFSRDLLQQNASLAADLFSVLQKNGPSDSLSRSYILRVIFLLQENRRYGGSLEKKEGRLRRLFRDNAVQNPHIDDVDRFEKGFTPETLFDALVCFGLLVPLAEKNRYRLHSALFTEEKAEETRTKAISIDAGFSVTVLKELPPALFFDITSCMESELCGAVSRFRITKAACLRAFENGISLEKLIDILEKNALHPLPQNVRFSLHDWHTLYNSGKLFKGYVLQVAEDKRLQTEKNPVLAAHIRAHLAPGIYLLDFTCDEEASDIIKKSSLEFIGGIQGFETQSESLPFAALVQHKDLLTGLLSGKPLISPDCIENIQTDKEFQRAHIAAMKAEVIKKNLPKESEEALMLRIHRKTVLNAGQLSETSIRSEKNAASGMDFLGKIRIIENALAYSDFVEVVCAEKTLCGFPLGLEKKSSDAVLILQVEENREPERISVAQARLIRRKPSSVFSTR